MKTVFPAMPAILLFAGTVGASACDGTAGRDIAITTSGQKYTVTDTGREWVQVTFAAFGTTYNLQLAPGQSATPRTTGMLSQPMSGYQSCVATPLPVPVSGAVRR